MQNHSGLDFEIFNTSGPIFVRSCDKLMSFFFFGRLFSLNQGKNALIRKLKT